MKTVPVIDEETQAEIHEGSRAVLPELRDEYIVVEETDEHVVLAVSHIELDAISKDHDVPYGAVVEMMAELRPDHIDTGVGSPYEYDSPLVVELE